MKIMVTGAGGQLGKDLVDSLGQHHQVIALTRAELDITNQEQCKQIIHTVRPDAVIHAAAYTAVDLAESEEDQAYAVNAFGTRNIAAAVQEIGAKLCYISTDYVFDGNSNVPYREYDNTNPTGVYGKSKRAGEQLVQSLCERYFIVRTSWVYGKYGSNFVKTMLKLGQDKKELKVVHDQIGSPTYTVDLSCFLETLVLTEKYGIYHASNSGICSWYEFAQAIFAESGANVVVHPCTTEEFPRPAPRPKFSVMDHLSIRANGFQDLRPWQEALREFLQNMNNGD
ncbi:MAG: dTDP-4-dehydrorhamnose reductase [Paenibacillus sp. RIFOXYA1_FULL_44_5]|nr:MAG: dTDP-4-dehydrorhamnose reductase [Paenibacillus sp. RIFOXYA1_FULL_44_5]